MWTLCLCVPGPGTGMKLDANALRFLTKSHFRVLTAIEMGMRNHESTLLALRLPLTRNCCSLATRKAATTTNPNSNLHLSVPPCLLELLKRCDIQESVAVRRLVHEENAVRLHGALICKVFAQKRHGLPR